MEFNMEFVATIAVVASVLVFAYQARELARQSRVGNEVAVTSLEQGARHGCHQHGQRRQPRIAPRLRVVPVLQRRGDGVHR